MKFKPLLAATAVALASANAHAGSMTGNVGVVSDYMFRGIDQSIVGAAVQGGVDYAFDFGAYTGLWVTNSSLGGGNEADVYAGYGLDLGAFDLDAGVIYYGYTEDTEAPAAPNADFAELYLGGGVGPASLKVFYTNAYGRDVGLVSGNTDKDDALYVTASVTLTLNDTVAFTPQIGFSSGDGIKDAYGDTYTDYSITGTKKLKDDWSVSLAVAGTDRELPAGSDNGDNPKFIVGIKKNFNI